MPGIQRQPCVRDRNDNMFRIIEIRPVCNELLAAIDANNLQSSAHLTQIHLEHICLLLRLHQTFVVLTKQAPTQQVCELN